jgi:hypothetical protein
MSDEIKPTDMQENPLTAKVSLDPANLDPGKLDSAGAGADASKIPLPGVIAIALYMLVLAAVITFGAVGSHVPKIFLVLAPLFITASFGLLRMFRWAWALTLAAVFLLMSYNLWLFFLEKQAPGAVQGVLNLVFFLYLVREDVRSRLR